MHTKINVLFTLNEETNIYFDCNSSGVQAMIKCTELWSTSKIYVSHKVTKNTEFRRSTYFLEHETGSI